MAEENNNAPEAAADGAQPAGPQFALQRIYLKDTSFESPKSPQIFQAQWSPKINFDIKTRNTKVADDVYEVVLVLTVEAQLEEANARVDSAEQLAQAEANSRIQFRAGCFAQLACSPRSSSVFHMTPAPPGSSSCPMGKCYVPLFRE